MIDKNRIPQGWEIVKHSEVAEINPKLPFKNVDDDTEVSFLPMKLIEEEKNVFYLTEFRKYKDVKKGFTPVTDGDVIFAKITPCMENGKCAILHDLKNGIGFGSTEFHVSRARECVIAKYIFYFIIQQEFRRIAESNMTGSVGQKRVPTLFFSEFKIPLPPLPEQHRIVAKIEELFSELDKGIESLKTARQQLKIYRQAVLKWAFEGRLTHDNVKDGELPEEWRKTKIVDVAAINPKLPYENIMDTLEVSFLPMKLVEEEKNQIHLTEFKKYSETKKGFTPMTNGDVIFAKITPCMENGKIAVVHSLKNNIAFGSTEFHVLRCKDNLSNYFLFYFLVQEKFRKEAEHNMTGAVGQRRVPKKFIEDSIIPVPPLYEQHQIVQEIETRLSVCDKLEETITTALQQGEALRQSILKKAFAGKLVAQNPEDEPATKLLERIKAEKAAEQQNVYKKSAPLTKQRYKIK